MHGVIQATLDAGHQSVLDSSAAGGEFSVMDAEVEEMLVAKQEELVDDLIADGQLPEDIRDQMHGLADKWTGIVEELGYTDDGELRTSMSGTSRAASISGRWVSGSSQRRRSSTAPEQQSEDDQ